MLSVEKSRSAQTVVTSWTLMTPEQRARNKQTTDAWKARNPERVKANKRRWDLENKARKAEHDKQYAARHAEKIKDYKRRWYVHRYSEPQWRIHKMVQSAATRARREGTAWEASLLQQLPASPPSNCVACARALDYSKPNRKKRNNATPSIDRADNTQGYTTANTRIICFRCNRIKSDASLSDLRGLVAYMGQHNAAA